MILSISFNIFEYNNLYYIGQKNTHTKFFRRAEGGGGEVSVAETVNRASIYNDFLMGMRIF